MNKKVVFTVFTLAIVAALLTIARTAHTRLSGETGIMPMMQSTEVGTAMMAKSAPINDMMVDPAYGGSMLMYRNSGDALNVVNRVQEVYSSHGVVTASVADYMKETKAYISSIGGTVLSYSLQSSRGMTSASLVAKVPVARFEAATQEITAKADRVVDESVQSQDITAQQVSVVNTIDDLKKDIITKEAAIAAAKTDVEKKRLQYELEILNRQLKSAEQSQAAVAERVEYATMSITAADSARYFDPTAHISLVEEVKDAFRSLGGATGAIGRLLIWVVVYAVLWLPLVIGAQYVLGHLHHSKK